MSALKFLGSLSFLLLAAGTRPAQVPIANFPVPPPKYEVRVEKSVMVPMRDGVRLATDLYFPEGINQPLPTILIRTPYGKNSPGSERNARRYAAQGYAVAVQDVRGKFESEGEYTVSAADGKDGFDTVEWIATQRWSSGKIGTTGCSYSGENQVEMSRLRSLHHLAMNPQAASGGMQYFASWRGGAFELAADADWFVSNGRKTKPQPADSPPPKVDWPSLWRSLPLKGMMDHAGVQPTDWDDFVSHPEGDPWWRTLGYVDESDKFDVPALFVDAWYDYGVGDTFRLADLIRKNSGSPQSAQSQFIVVAPTTHCRYEAATEHTVVGTRDVGDARYLFFGLYLAWFDHWLKGADNGVEKMPKVQIYVMGKNEWRGEKEWPLGRTRFTQYYLRSEGRANSRYGDGFLSTDHPASEPPDQFTYDPRTPVPTVGGPDWGGSDYGLKSGAQDQSEVEMRQDVLVYTTPPLEKGLEITGPLEVVLYVSSDASDTDFTAKLVDVFPDETAYNVQEGILRARYREGFQEKKLMKRGENYEVHINLNATSNFFRPGHRLRLEISSSNFPRFDRNLNTGRNNFDEISWRVAHNMVYHEAARASYILLPLIP